MRIYFLFFCISILTVSAVVAQTTDSLNARPFTIWIDGGAGYSRNISPGLAATAASGTESEKNGFTGLLRLRGSRSHFISIGIETGWQFISSVSQQNAQVTGFGTTNITATLSAVPVMGVVTLQDYNIELHGSVGLCDLISKASLFGNTITSTEWDMAFSIAASYEITIPGEYKIIPEFRWLRINDQQKSFLSLMIRIQLPELVL